MLREQRSKPQPIGIGAGDPAEPEARIRSRPKGALVLALLGALLVVAILLGAGLGSVRIAPLALAEMTLDRLGLVHLSWRLAAAGRDHLLRLTPAASSGRGVGWPGAGQRW